MSLKELTLIFKLEIIVKNSIKIVKNWKSLIGHWVVDVAIFSLRHSSNVFAQFAKMFLDVTNI